MNPLGQVWTWITKGAAYLMGLFSAAVPSLVTRFLAAYGLTMVSFNAVLPQLKSFVLQYVSALPPEAMNFLGAIGLGKAMSMILSALTVAWAHKTFIVPTSVADQYGVGGSP